MTLSETLVMLLIEDDQQCARMVQKVLSPHGYIVHHAKTGLAGLELARQIYPQIILLDMNLPDIDGKVVANQLRSYAKNSKRVPVVAFTAEAGPRARQMALAFGCDEFISKPIDTHVFPDQIALIMQTALSGGSKS